MSVRLCSKDLIVVKFGPTYVWLQSCKLPNPIHLAVVHDTLAIGVSLELDTFQIVVGIFLMSYTHLMMASDLCLAYFDPFGCAPYQVLGFDAYIPQKMRARCHAH